MRSKRELIERFINENLPQIHDSDHIADEFTTFWDKEHTTALDKLSKEKNLQSDKLQTIIDNYLFTEKNPLHDEIIGILNQRPSQKNAKPYPNKLQTRSSRLSKHSSAIFLEVSLINS